MQKHIVKEREVVVHETARVTSPNETNWFNMCTVQSSQVVQQEHADAFPEFQTLY